MNKLKTLAACGALSLAAASLLTPVASASPELSLNDFYRHFELAEITAENMQRWPYYLYTSMNWDSYGIFGAAPIAAAEAPAKLIPADQAFDIESELKPDYRFVDSLLATQTKGFLVIKGDRIFAEFYDNGLNRETSQLLQSSSKTYAGVLVSRLIDQKQIDPGRRIDSYLEDFRATSIGRATVQQVLDMQSGLLPATDYHVPGGEAYEFEIEQGLKPGVPEGHRKAVRQAKIQAEPGVEYNYNDKNTDLLAMLAEAVTGRSFNTLLGELFADFGANSQGSIALTADGTASPSYGISTTLRDYGLFHQWIARGQAPDSFYASLQQLDKDLLSQTEAGQALAAALGTPVVYGSQTWYFPEHNIVYSAGSYGQYGFSDLESGISVVFMQDWEDNAVTHKLVEMVQRALFVIEQLRD